MQRKGVDLKGTKMFFRQTTTQVAAKYHRQSVVILSLLKKRTVNFNDSEAKDKKWTP